MSRLIIPGIDVKLIFPGDDSSENEAFLDVLREQNIDCSDWDYMLVFDNSDLFRPVYDEVYANVMEPKDSYTIERLLTGCSDNIFFQVWINDEEKVVGIAYHS